MEHDQTVQQQDIGRNRRLLLKLLGMGGLAGAGVVSLASQATASSETVQATPTATTGLFSYVAAKNVDAVSSFMQAAFGATQTQRFADAGGTYHATLNIGGADMYVGRENASMNFLAASSLGSFSAFVMVVTPSADSSYSRALAAGARSLQPPTNMPFGRRTACVIDPFGQPWQINEVLPGSPTAAPTTVAPTGVSS
jgi:PhnB protein